jgi:hypothetical protein
MNLDNEKSLLDDKIIIDYDIETFLSIFCVVFKSGDRYLSFEISERKNDIVKLIEFMKKAIVGKWYYCGFNNVRFDAQILQWMLDENRTNITSKEIHAFAQEVIEKSNKKEFPPYPEYKLDILQIDLFLQNHYNNLNRSTSLKWLEFSMNWPKVQDLPYKHDAILSTDTFDSIIEYCKNDVDATSQFRSKTKKMLELRFSQHALNPDLNLLNKSDSSVGEALFLDLMSEKLDIKKSILKKKQTHHKQIHLKDVILPYINFKTPEFNSVLEYFKTRTVTIEEPNFKHIQHYDGIDYVYGIGGLHASLSNKIVEEDENHILLDIDGASFYPHLSFKNNFYPNHLSEEFCKLYQEKYNERKAIPKSNPQNTSLKLLLNSLYGKSGDIYSFVYDRKFMMSITVNGQLLLSMLAERMSFIEGVTVFYANTDGITLKVHKSKKKQVYKVWKWWEKLTQIQLEHAVYKKMIIRDVNNYISILEDKVKLKGAFEIDVDYHKNRSQRIVPIAVKRYFAHDVPVEETITQHLIHKKNYGDVENQGIFDFCIGKKIKHNQKYSLEKKTYLELPEHESKEEQKDFIESYSWKEFDQNKWGKDEEGKSRGFTDAYRTCLREIYPEYEKVETITDKVLRFYVSTKGLQLNKNYSDGRVEITVGGNKVTKFMDYYENDDYDIDYQYYIDEANKLVHEVDGTNDRLAEEAKIKRAKEKIAKEQERELKIKERQEEMFVKYCVTENGPTKNQYERYKTDWLIEKYGEPKNIR